MFKGIIVAAAAGLSIIPSGSTLEPIRLRSGVNQIPNIAGDGVGGSITLDWKDNGNAWGYDIFSVRVGGSIATVEEADRFTDSPHTGDDMIKSVRFARGVYGSHKTTFALVAERNVIESVPAPARTNIKIYVLLRNKAPLGTPYEFVRVREFYPKRHYCNADMALKTELNFPLARTYSGTAAKDGC